MYYGTQRADGPLDTSVAYDYSKSLQYHLIAIGITFFDFNTGRMLTLCDLPGHGHYIPYEYLDCNEYYRAEKE